MSVVGVDLGGTKVAVALLSERALGESVIRPTDLSGSDALVDQLTTMIMGVGRDGVEAVGVGAPSVVEFETGRIVSSVNIPLADVPLREVLSERTGIPVFVDNDATVAALAEAHDADLRLLARDLVMITVGTGVGGGLVLGGRIYRGATGGAGEIGHTIVGLDLSGRVARPAGPFPHPGSLEYVASGHALDRLAAEDAERRPDSLLGRVQRRKRVTGEDTVDAGHAGDPDALRILEVWAEHVGIGVANAINTFDPEEVVIGGGAARAGQVLIDAVRRVASQYVLPGLGGRTTIRLARHGVRAGVLGAALLAVHELQTMERTEEVSR